MNKFVCIVYYENLEVFKSCISHRNLKLSLVLQDKILSVAAIFPLDFLLKLEQYKVFCNINIYIAVTNI